MHLISKNTLFTAAHPVREESILFLQKIRSEIMEFLKNYYSPIVLDSLFSIIIMSVSSGTYSRLMALKDMGVVEVLLRIFYNSLEF